MKDDFLIEMRGITKRFGNTVANENVNFTLKKGEIHALLGENGAGKSTLMNMLSGMYAPDSGELLIHGKKAKITSPKQAIDVGIGMIHQHFKLIEIMTALENIILGQTGGLLINKNKVSKQIENVTKLLDMEIELEKKVYNMSVGEKQTLEIIKVIHRGADILILDEPTAVLTPQENQKLFKILKKMKDEGCGIIIITHKLHEVMEISDRVTVLRKGKNVGTVSTAETTAKELTDLMVGYSVDLKIERAETHFNQNILSVEKLNYTDAEGIKMLSDISFGVEQGEILGVAGVAGSGQKELCETIAGILTADSGQIQYEGKNILGKSCREIIELGITMSFIPEDRLGMGLVASMDMVDNIILKDYYHQKGIFLTRKDTEIKAKEMITKYDIKTPGIHHPVRQLSGGNIQKVLLGREIESNPHLLITAYPTRGLDIASSHKIYDLINEQKKKGVAVIYIGEDLDVLMELSDRIMVLCDGKITGIVDAKMVTKQQLGLLMAGETLEGNEVVQ